MRNLRPIVVLRLLPLLAGFAAVLADRCQAAELTLAPVFGDHAVLQRGKSVPVWGTAGASDSVTVTFHGQKATTSAGADGRWSLSIGPFEASSDGADLVVAAGSTVTLHDVVVGEVWLCSGQSNMEFVVDDGSPNYRVDHSEGEIASANFPMIRQLKVAQTVATSPAATVKTGGWVPASPTTVGTFTAVGYFFARDIHRALGVPVGIIDSPWGGTPVESWMSDAARNSTSLAAELDARWNKAKSEWTPERQAKWVADKAAWDKAVADSATKHTKNTLMWPAYPANDESPFRPGGLFNAMIAPLQPAAVRGILWYQGESNADRPGEYAELFAAMIRSWREGFGQGNLPFYFVQLANYGSEYEVVDRNWARLREAQAKVLALPNTGMAVAIDIGNARDIHPKNKQEVGRRLALIAKTNVYGIAPEVSGPVFASAEREGKSLRIRFAHACGELSPHGGTVTSLEVAGADKVFYPAMSVIEGESLIASSPDVKEPVAVRYAWTNSPNANLYGDNGLPVAPFRSDDW